MKALLVAAVAFASIHVLAAPVLNPKCVTQIESLVAAAARTMSGDKTAGIVGDSLNDQTEDAGLDPQGRHQYKVGTGKIFVGEGYLQGDGATLLVVPTGKSCEILKMKISID